MKLPAILAIVGVLSGIPGCGAGVRSFGAWHDTSVQGARPHASDTFPVEAVLAPASLVTVELGVSGARLDEGGLTSPALLFQLPRLDRVHVLTLKSKLHVDAGVPGLVYPRVRLLDAQRVPTREFASNQFIYREDLQVTVFLDPTRRAERFVLITADAVPVDRLLRVQSLSGPPHRELASFARGVLVLDFRPEPIEHVPFP
mgnify:CR=1 FL=1|jgi:hypothetical protein